MSSELWMWLAAGLGWGAVNSGELLAAHAGGAAEIYESLGSDKLDEILTQKQAERLARTRPEDFALRIAHAGTIGVLAIGFDDERYPAALKSINNPPPILFVKGDVSLLNGQLAIAMVGSRRPSAYGVEAVKALGRGIAMGGAIIVSGLAAGLDAEAHKAALAVNGPTIACIAFGHEQCYPAANRKLMEIIEHSGAVISEYPPGTSPEKPYFLQRNRIIAGISHGLVVVEARKHSGTMSTVNFSADYGRDVFAVPGGIFSELSSGTNAMLREGAYLAASAADVLNVYGVELPGEDPVALATKQAAQGRPVAAASPWEQSLDRFASRSSEAQTSEVRQELPGQQTLGEMIRSQMGDSKGPISAKDAMDAFNMLQKGTTAADSQKHSPELDRMADAVSDKIEFSGGRQSTQRESEAQKKVQEKAAPNNKPADGISLFPWERVERLEKDSIENLSPASNTPKPSTKGKRPSLASRLLGGVGQGAESTVKAAPTPQHAQAASTAVPSGRVERISAVGRTMPIEPVYPVQPAASAPQAAAVQPRQSDARAAGVTSVAAEQAATAPQAKPQMAAAQPRQSDARAAAQPRQSDARAAVVTSAAAEQVATVPQAKPQTAAIKPPTIEQAVTAPQAQRGGGMASRLSTLKADAPTEKAGVATPKLSDEAKLAFKQLGPVPKPLGEICEQSGLSSAAAMAALTELELAGLSRQLAGRQFAVANV